MKIRIILPVGFTLAFLGVYVFQPKKGVEQIASNESISQLLNARTIILKGGNYSSEMNNLYFWASYTPKDKSTSRKALLSWNSQEGLRAISKKLDMLWPQALITAPAKKANCEKGWPILLGVTEMKPILKVVGGHSQVAGVKQRVNGQCINPRSGAIVSEIDLGENMYSLNSITVDQDMNYLLSFNARTADGDEYSSISKFHYARGETIEIKRWKKDEATFPRNDIQLVGNRLFGTSKRKQLVRCEVQNSAIENCKIDSMQGKVKNLNKSVRGDSLILSTYAAFSGNRIRNSQILDLGNQDLLSSTNHQLSINEMIRGQKYLYLLNFVPRSKSDNAIYRVKI